MPFQQHNNTHHSRRLPFTTVCGPMVRYSKLPFRLLCIEGGTDIVYTPMILADCFAKSVLARDTDLQTDRKSVV